MVKKEYEVEKIVLFGSRAKGDYKPTSDIDLAIFYLPKFTGNGYSASDLEDLDTLLKIDITFINEHTDSKLLGNIEREGISLYERSKY